MNSGTFHVISQQWRYFSREKAIVHTLHLGQLAPMVTGQTITISTVPPTGSGSSANKFRTSSGTYPFIVPYKGLNFSKVTLNVPPLWADNSQQAVLSTGSYGFTGTFGPANSNVSNNSFEWSATGGTFLLIGDQNACFNGLIYSSERNILFYSNQDQVFQNEFHEGQTLLHLVGPDWNNQFFAQGPRFIETTCIIQGIPPFTSEGVRNVTSNIEPDGPCSFFGFDNLVFRLGP